MIGLIWGQARDDAGRPVIGAGGRIPWHVPEDFAHFKRTTAGHPVVMGRLTWESLPRRPLPGRTNVVISSGCREPRAAQELADGGAVPAASIGAALETAARAPGGEEVWVMGGSRVYDAALPLADVLDVCEIDVEVAGDVFAPEVGPQWAVASSTQWATSSSGLRFRHLVYRRA